MRDTVLGSRSPRKLFCKEQRAFYAKHAPDGLALDDLQILGPIFVLKLRRVPVAFGRKLVIEVWLYPDGSHILELSTKCRPDEALAVAAQTRAYLMAQGVDLGGAQQTKTRAALAFYSAQLAAAAAATP